MKLKRTSARNRGAQAGISVTPNQSQGTFQPFVGPALLGSNQPVRVVISGSSSQPVNGANGAYVMNLGTGQMLQQSGGSQVQFLGGSNVQEISQSADDIRNFFHNFDAAENSFVPLQALGGQLARQPPRQLQMRQPAAQLSSLKPDPGSYRTEQSIMNISQGVIMLSPTPGSLNQGGSFPQTQSVVVPNNFTKVKGVTSGAATGWILTKSGFISSAAAGVAQPPKVVAPVSLPVEEDALYVNAKQYHRILKRREARLQLEADGRIPKYRSKYMHESRHHHALNRIRNADGRFDNTKKKRARKSRNDQEQACDADDEASDGPPPPLHENRQLTSTPLLEGSLMEMDLKCGATVAANSH